MTKVECLRRFIFTSYEDTYREVAKYMDFYNHRRIHSSILDLPPNEFYQRVQTEDLVIKEGKHFNFPSCNAQRNSF
ncbi:IS3 family transposase [Metabacillus fastidiosus]|uniref:IS3 family transposase n=1 Tax=Metabacillus fastidiosus TaxID=1458 RepID=UPI00350E3EA1